MSDGTAEDGAPKTAGAFGGLSASEAAKRRWEKQRERDAQEPESARRVNATGRSPLDALRDLMSEDPDAYAEGLAKLVRAGDPRSITIMRDLFQAQGSVAVPRAEATIRAMSSEDRRALLLHLEERGATLPDALDEQALEDA